MSDSTYTTDNYTQEEIDTYKDNKSKIFRGTLTICIVYGAIALILILLGYFTNWGRRYILEDLFPFIITYIVGTIIIILLLSNYISNYKPTRIDNKLSFDSDICPDYWILTKNDENLKYGPNVNANLMKYKCVIDSNVYDKNKIYDSSKNIYTGDDEHIAFNIGRDNANNINTLIKNTDELNEFRNYAAYMNGFENKDKSNDGVVVSYKNSRIDDTGSKPVKTDINNNDYYYYTGNTTVSYNQDQNIPLVCDEVYPLYLAAMDEKYSSVKGIKNKNTFRCNYAKVCNVPWTEAGCSKKDTI